MKKEQRIAKRQQFIYLLISVTLTFCCQSQGFAQQKEDDDAADNQRPVQERDVGDSLIENLAELPGQIVTLPFHLLIEGVKLLQLQRGYLRMTDWLTSEDETRRFRPIFSPGSGGGGTFTQTNLFHNSMRLRAHASFGNRSRRLILGSLHDPALFSQKWGFHLNAFNHRKPDEDFYGAGNDAREMDRTDFLEEETNVMGTFLFYPRQSMSFGLGVGYSDVSIKAGRDERQPNLDSLFTPSQLPGFFGGKMGTVTLKFYRNARNEAGHPTRGGEQLIAVQFSRDGDLGFVKYTLDLRKYIELFYGRVLALRVRADMTEDLGDREVPFYRLPGLGGEDLLKGYQSFRFRDDDLAYVSAEYRVPLNPMVYMTLFIEEGRVFRNIFKDFTLSHWHYSYGGGLRLRAPNGGLITTILIARSAEGTRFLFGLNTELGGI